MKIKNKDIPGYGALALTILTIVFSAGIWVHMKNSDINNLRNDYTSLQCQIYKLDLRVTNIIEWNSSRSSFLWQQIRKSCPLTETI